LWITPNWVNCEQCQLSDLEGDRGKWAVMGRI
jgi:hypothetical protein